MNDGQIRAVLDAEAAALERRDHALHDAIRAEMDRNRIDLTIKRDPFATVGQAFKEYNRLGYFATFLDKDGLRDPFDGETLVVRADGLALVTCREDIPIEADAPEWNRAPLFVDEEGAETFLFASAGELDATVFGCEVRSWNDLPQGFGRLASYVALPPTKGSWLRRPTRAKFSLPRLPASIRFKLAQRQAEGDA